MKTATRFEAFLVLSAVLVVQIASAETAREQAQQWVEKGMALNNNSDEEAACYLKAIEIDPTYANAYFNLGYVYQAQGKNAEAIAAFQACLDRDQNRLDAYANLAALLSLPGGTQDLQAALGALYRCQDLELEGTDSAKLAADIKRLEERISELKQAGIKDYYSQADIESHLTRRFTRGQSPYTGPRLPVRIQFAYDNARILPESEAQLMELAQALKSERLANVAVLIEGHTCDIGTVEYNRELSLRRAASVKDFLEKQGIPADRLRIEGKSKLQPIQPNDSEEHRAANRRVEFVNWDALETARESVRRTTRGEASEYDQFLQ